MNEKQSKIDSLKEEKKILKQKLDQIQESERDQEGALKNNLHNRISQKHINIQKLE